MCETFLKLEQLEIVETDIHSISPNAFVRCKEMESLKLIKTRVKNGLTGQIFDSNVNLRELVLDGVGLTTFDCDLVRNLEKLETLVVANNKLKYIAFYRMPRLDRLRNLVVSANHLLDFDEHEILRKCPSLTNIDISQNYLDCTRVQLMLEAFKTRDVYVGRMWRRDNVPFILGIETKKVGEVECSEFISNEFQTERLMVLVEEVRWNRHLMYNFSVRLSENLSGNGNSSRVMIYTLFGLVALNFCLFLVGMIWMNQQLKNKILIKELEANSRTVVTYSK